METKRKKIFVFFNIKGHNSDEIDRRTSHEDSHKDEKRTPESD